MLMVASLLSVESVNTKRGKFLKLRKKCAIFLNNPTDGLTIFIMKLINELQNKCCSLKLC